MDCEVNEQTCFVKITGYRYFSWHHFKSKDNEHSVSLSEDSMLVIMEFLEEFIEAGYLEGVITIYDKKYSYVYEGGQVHIKSWTRKTSPERTGAKHEGRHAS